MPLSAYVTSVWSRELNSNSSLNCNESVSCINTMEETIREAEASTDDEFSSVVIPIFANSVVTGHGCQDIPDSSAVSPIDTENIFLADSVSETSESNITHHESPSTSPNKRTIWDSNREDIEEIVADEIHSMAEVSPSSRSSQQRG